MQLTFYGAAGEVTGSCHLLQVNGHRLLLDCGLIQGSAEDEARNARDFPFAANEIDAVLLSHAHLDHSGRLPLLMRRGFNGPVHTHNATRELCAVLLRDAAHLQELEIRRENRHRAGQRRPPVQPLYGIQDAEHLMRQIVGHRYGEAVEADGAPGVLIEPGD